MAVTIADSPNNFSILNQKLIYVCTSGNVANTGFRFQFEITIDGDTLTFLVPPNPNNRGIMDIREAIRGYFVPLLAPEDPDNSSIHELGIDDNTLHVYEDAASSTWIMDVDVVVKEAWIISGVFTPTAVGQATDAIVVYGGTFNSSGVNGFLFPSYKFDPETSEYGFRPAFTDRDTNTNKNGFVMATTYGFSSASVHIPVVSTDYGILTFLLDNGTLLPSVTTPAKIKMVIYDSSGAPTTTYYNVTANGTGRIVHFGAYPANLNGTAYVGMSVLTAFPNFRAYTISLVDSGNAQIGNLYVFYPVDNYDMDGYDCLTGDNRIRAAWLNSMGGWDYFNFTKSWINRYEMERKRMRRVIGTYGSTTFDYEPYDRGLEDVGIDSHVSIVASSDWIEAGEFELLGQMMRSRNVMLLNEDIFSTTPLPVVLDNTNWDQQKVTFTNLKKVEVTFKAAIQLW